MSVDLEEEAEVDSEASNTPVYLQMKPLQGKMSKSSCCCCNAKKQ